MRESFGFGRKPRRCPGEGGYVLPGVLALLALVFLLAGGCLSALALDGRAQRDFLDYQYAGVLADNAFARCAAALEENPDFTGFSGEAAAGSGGQCELRVLRQSAQERWLTLRLRWQNFESLYEGQAVFDEGGGVQLFYYLID
ncbi:MAG: hypothetical protein Q4C55_03605 [Eubacterium sp.]|nr:hypothetical protein [Eubacterium sp.]